MHPTYLGSGARMANAYVLFNSQGIYEGQRATNPETRVFILTRSAFAGLQRYASATWSGDVAADWASLRAQIPAGLNMALSGLPWWTTDVGGFAVPRKWSRPDPRGEDVEEWRELVTRWFQFATFSPLLRVHGQFPHREMWFFGADQDHRAFRTQLAFDRLRYRMLPYTYSLAAAVTHRHGSILRPLVMDFREDPEVLAIGDQYLFGPSLLVSPVTSPGATRRPVYLPRGAGWYDLWTGAYAEGGRRLDAAAPYESIPVYVKAGSILPMGPELQHTAEKPADPLTVWVYTGADAAFDLYEDDGVSYAYERGAFATTPLRWDEARGVLTVGPRAGAFPGMLPSRRVRVVFVTRDSPAGHTADPQGAVETRFDGQALQVALPRQVAGLTFAR
jgi:alpha-D-xyloside xylohydrolase